MWLFTDIHFHDDHQFWTPCLLHLHHNQEILYIPGLSHHLQQCSVVTAMGGRGLSIHWPGIGRCFW